MTEGANRAAKWWNSLPASKQRELILDAWSNEGCPEPIKKKITAHHKGIKLVGWGERRKMLIAFPGGSVIFSLFDAGGNPVGISVGATMDDERADILNDARREFIEMVGREPRGLTLRYSETCG